MPDAGLQTKFVAGRQRESDSVVPVSSGVPGQVQRGRDLEQEGDGSDSQVRGACAPLADKRLSEEVLGLLPVPAVAPVCAPAQDRLPQLHHLPGGAPVRGGLRVPRLLQDIQRVHLQATIHIRRLVSTSTEHAN